MVPAVVVSASTKNGVEVQMPDGKRVKLNSRALGFAARAVNNKSLGDAQIRRGSLIRLQKGNSGWFVVQEPLLQGALVSLEAKTGAIRALVGGYDFHSKTFNRATQAKRQPGSTFKPFIYSAALAKGMTAATVVNDAPISLPGQGINGRTWEPKNADGRYSGFITMRQALTYSKNMVSIRLLMATGIPYAQQYIQRFGFNPADHPAGYSMSLGTGLATPLQMAEGYAVFANGGYKVNGYVIDKIYDSQNNLKAQMQPLVAGQNAPQVIDPRNAFIMYKMMQDVVRRGTATGAGALGRSDIAGKTGTTNDAKDAWFVGFTPEVVTAVYVGFDKPKSLGSSAFGGTVALPVWVNYMKVALKGMPSKGMAVPAGVVNRGGEYFLKEQQVTDPKLALDNRASGPVNSPLNNNTRRRPSANGNGNNDSSTPATGEVPVEPINRAPQPAQQGGGNKESSQLDSLF